MYGAKNRTTSPTQAGRESGEECGEENDPYGVIPDYFCEAYGEETIPAALEAAERAQSTTAHDEMKRCPKAECGSVRIRHKPGMREMDHKVDTAYVCSVCRTHFSEPAPPLAEADE